MKNEIKPGQVYNVHAPLIIKFFFFLSKNLGLILNAVYPFRSIDYTSYRSAGFRGQLDKGFHTINGLTHVFVPGMPLETVPDLE